MRMSQEPGRAWKSLEDLRVFSSLGWPRFQMEAWGNSSIGQPLGLDFDSQARWKMCRHGKDGSDDRSDWNYVCFSFIQSFFSGNASSMFNIQTSWDPCCRSDLSVWCTGGSLCLWCCTSSDLSDCACWCLQLRWPNGCPFPAQMGGTCSAARQPLGRERRGHLCTSDRSLCERVRDDEMTRWVVGVELKNDEFSIWLSIWGLYVVSCRYEQSQFLGPKLLVPVSAGPRLNESICSANLATLWAGNASTTLGLACYTSQTVGWRPCLVSMLEKLHNFQFFPCPCFTAFCTPVLSWNSCGEMHAVKSNLKPLPWFKY